MQLFFFNLKTYPIVRETFQDHSSLTFFSENLNVTMKITPNMNMQLSEHDEHLWDYHLDCEVKQPTHVPSQSFILFGSVKETTYFKWLP